MKKIFLLVALIATVFTQNIFAQEGTSEQPASLLNTYYKLKDALVSSNSTIAAANAEALLKAINTSAKEVVPDDARAVLIKDANAISQSKDIKVQREKFATLSNNMFELAKTVKLSTDPIYQQYCPMKKATWLSNDKAIKNPYYGNAMLTCGSVKATL